ncbi:hypothetical protein RB691 [Rhodopirellula baltica SH 1]|uniref:Uncharacterized protein n=1 Tax=Rhodopirellula baltica (strain DSM 10527 / NCIMB 13988 / SH1) TaxID=243090 RepID=Q7UYD8_RHOBA|nr:hypothetical protein RB691 [Rhodopirellula baltica SH 1]
MGSLDSPRLGIERLGLSGFVRREMRDETGQVQREKPYDGLPRPSPIKQYDGLPRPSGEQRLFFGRAWKPNLRDTTCKTLQSTSRDN